MYYFCLFIYLLNERRHCTSALVISWKWSHAVCSGQEGVALCFSVIMGILSRVFHLSFEPKCCQSICFSVFLNECPTS